MFPFFAHCRPQSTLKGENNVAGLSKPPILAFPIIITIVFRGL